MDDPVSTSEFGQLRAFVAVAEALSFSRAAASLGVSPSALSQTIRALEERMGVSLLRRTTRSVSLSEAGSLLLQGAAPALAGLGEAMAQARRFRDKPAGHLRLHAFRASGERFLRPMLRSFAEAYPDILLDLTFDDRVVDIVAEGFDAGIRVGEVIAADMIAVKLGADLRQLPVASPEYLARHGRPMTPRDLTAHRCIGWRWEGQARAYAWEFCENGRWFEVAVTGPLLSSSREFCVQAALEGVGIAFATEPVVGPYLAEGRLVALLEPWCAPFPGVYLCYPAQRRMAPALRAFIDSLRASVPEGQS